MVAGKVGSSGGPCKGIGSQYQLHVCEPNIGLVHAPFMNVWTRS
jgi:hypothetical protein